MIPITTKDYFDGLAYVQPLATTDAVKSDWSISTATNTTVADSGCYYNDRICSVPVTNELKDYRFDSTISFPSIMPTKEDKPVSQPNKHEPTKQSTTQSDSIIGYAIPAIKKIRYEGRATTIFWMDGTKTTVRAMQDEPYDSYSAFIAAVAKKLFGSTSMAKRIHDRLDEATLKAQVAEEQRVKEAEAERIRNKKERREAKRIFKQRMKENRIEEMVQEYMRMNKKGE